MPMMMTYRWTRFVVLTPGALTCGPLGGKKMFAGSSSLDQWEADVPTLASRICVVLSFFSRGPFSTPLF